ncbi:MAG TPA: transporter [Gammaproteobacteria bacterium]|nr:transporter [Gammaproteobacteria bacterium]
MSSFVSHLFVTGKLYRFVCVALVMPGLWMATVAQAQPGAPMPEPMTLEFALQQAEAMHPDLLAAQADLELVQAEQARTESEFGINASVTGRLRYIEPSSTAFLRKNDDNKIALEVSKRLYDFGRHEAGLRASEEDIAARRLLLQDMIVQRRISIMQAYFDVLLADLAYIRDNEDMATAYVSFDRVKDRNELGQVSDIDLLEAESLYQQSRRKRYASDVARRVARSRLAISMNRTGELSSDLALPVLRHQKRKLPDLEQLHKQAKENNPVILALRRQMAAAQSRLERARAGDGPVIDAEMEVSQYSRETSGRDPFRVGLVFKVPLYTGGAVDADIARERAGITRLRADVLAKEMDVNQRLVERWQDIYVLQAQRDEVTVLQDFRDLYLDRSRAEYELDLKTDLGDAMGRFSEARLEAARVRYSLELAWERLEALTGQAQTEKTTSPDAVPAVEKARSEENTAP